MPEENFWTLWCMRRLTEADTPTIRLGATPIGLTSAHIHHPPFFTDRMPFLLPNQQRQSTEGNWRIRIREKTLEFSSTVLPAPSPLLLNKWWVTYQLCRVLVCAVCAANKDLTAQVSVFMVEMVCRYTLVVISQQAGNVLSLSDLLACRIASWQYFLNLLPFYGHYTLAGTPT